MQTLSARLGSRVCVPMSSCARLPCARLHPVRARSTRARHRSRLGAHTLCTHTVVDHPLMDKIEELEHSLKLENKFRRKENKAAALRASKLEQRIAELEGRLVCQPLQSASANRVPPQTECSSAKLFLPQWLQRVCAWGVSACRVSLSRAARALCVGTLFASCSHTPSFPALGCLALSTVTSTLSLSLSSVVREHILW